jgi:hypothetical protein
VAKEKTPIDSHTGIPYLMVPHWQVHDIMKSASKTGRFSDRNHVFFPRLHPLLQTIGGQAVRHARVQRVNRGEHNRYHELYDGPPLPQTEEEQFRATVFCVAKYIPPLALNMGLKKPGVEKLGPRQLRRLRESGEITMDSSRKVRDFMEGYVLDRGIEDIEKHKNFIGKFLLCPSDTVYDRQRQQHMARNLLTLAARGSAAELEQVYGTVHGQDLLHPMAPPDATNFIVDSIVGEHRIIHPSEGTIYSVIDALHDRFTGVHADMLAAKAAA